MTFGQHPQDFELTMREPQIAACARRESPPEVDGDTAQLNRADRRLHSAQHGMDAGDQLLHVERLGDVIVGAEAQSLQLVCLLTARRQNNDGSLPAVSEHASELEPAEIGQHHVKDHKIGHKRAVQCERALRMRGPLDFEAVHDQVVAQYLRER